MGTRPFNAHNTREAVFVANVDAGGYEEPQLRIRIPWARADWLPDTLITREGKRLVPVSAGSKDGKKPAVYRYAKEWCAYGEDVTVKKLAPKKDLLEPKTGAMPLTEQSMGLPGR